jgi:geranylgeranyl pyrophosphate synthase
MTTAAFALPSRPPLLDVLDAAFAPGTLGSIAGEVGEQVPWEIWRGALYGPIEDFLSRPGKQIRARLVEHGFRLVRPDGDLPPRLPLLVELIHAGSLIVDDIEDGSASRRGGPALHRVHGVPKALNAGNWLYFLPFSLLAELPLEPEVRFALFERMGRCLLRCHYGQALDLSAHMSRIPQAHVPAVVETATRLKTGALLEFSVMLGALVAGAGPVPVRRVGRFGMALGTGLQILDDLGGLVSTARCDKGHEDLVGGRPTWPWAWLARDLEAAPYEALQRLARDVEARDRHPELLAEAMREHLGPKAAARVRAHLRSALRDVEAAFPGAPVLGDLRADIEQLEQSYG